MDARHLPDQHVEDPLYHRKIHTHKGGSRYAQSIPALLFLSRRGWRDLAGTGECAGCRHSSEGGFAHPTASEPVQWNSRKPGGLGGEGLAPSLMPDCHPQVRLSPRILEFPIAESPIRTLAHFARLAG